MSEVVIDHKTIEKMAHLSRLSLNKNDIEKYTQDLSQVLSWFTMIDEVDVSNVQPANHAHDYATPMREDSVNDGKQGDLIIQNAKDSKFNMFSVPKAVE